MVKPRDASVSRCEPPALKYGWTRANYVAEMPGSAIRKQIKACALFLLMVYAQVSGRLNTRLAANAGYRAITDRMAFPPSAK